MDDLIKPLLSRVAASIVGALVTYLAGRGFNLDPETSAAAATFLGGLMLAVYGVVHKLLDKKLNPGDAAAKQNVQHGVEVKHRVQQQDIL